MSVKRLTLAVLLLIFSYSVAQFGGVEVVVTYYHPVWWQTDDTPFLASCGPLDEAPKWQGERIVALSRDLFFKDGHKRCGEHVVLVLKGHGVIHGVVWDTMNSRFRRYVDVMYEPFERPKWGITRGLLFGWSEFP